MSGALEYLGVIEGFYGRPWTSAERQRLFGWMANWGMNTYLYAPKDDLWHRARWREPYPAQEEQALAGLVAAARRRGIRFVYALAPGLDLNWVAADGANGERADAHDAGALTRKIASLADVGVQDFALLFDDIPVQPDRAAQARVQVEAAHLVLRLMEERGLPGRLLFCPTEYCAEQAIPDVQTSPYLATLGAHLDARIEVFWTGPQIVSPMISPDSLREVAAALRRRPLLWDNLHASDYTSHRLHLGPYSGRPLELRAEVSGILSNPNTPFEPNFPSLASLADYAAVSEETAPHWTAEASGRRALNAWLHEFTPASTTGQPVTGEDLALLADILHLPDRLGPRAAELLDSARRVVQNPSDTAARTVMLDGRRRLRRTLHALEQGPNRSLHYDLHPFLVDVFEELTRLLAAGRGGRTTFSYRGGLADRLLTLGWPEAEEQNYGNRLSGDLE